MRDPAERQADGQETPPAKAPAPGFGELLRANLRVLLWATLVALLAYGAWRGLRFLFPDVSWLQ